MNLAIAVSEAHGSSDSDPLTFSTQSGWFPLYFPSSTDVGKAASRDQPKSGLALLPSGVRCWPTLPVLWSTQGRLILDTNCTVGGTSG